MTLTKTDLSAIGTLLDEKLKVELKIQKGEIYKELVDFVEDRILPQIDETNKKLDKVQETVNRIESRQDKQEDRLDEHAVMLDKLNKIHPKGQHTSA
mgnify:CR=1 FL=1